MAERPDLKALAAAFARTTPGFLRETGGLAGLGAMTWGAHLIYAPAGWIVGGAFLAIAAFVLAPKT